MVGLQHMDGAIRQPAPARRLRDDVSLAIVKALRVVVV
jgi:hypothetical protein